MAVTRDQLDAIFTYHAPTDSEQEVAYTKVRLAGWALAEINAIAAFAVMIASRTLRTAACCSAETGVTSRMRKEWYRMFHGASRITLAQPTLFLPVDVSAAGDNLVVRGDPAMKIRVFAYFLVPSGVVSVRWKSGLDRVLSGLMNISTGAPLASQLGSETAGWLMETDPGQDLILNLSAAVQVGGHLSYQFDTE